MHFIVQNESKVKCAFEAFYVFFFNVLQAVTIFFNHFDRYADHIFSIEKCYNSELGYECYDFEIKDSMLHFVFHLSIGESEFIMNQIGFLRLRIT